MAKAEIIHHPDTGCKKAKEMGYYGKCLACPFLECLEIAPLKNPKKGIRDGVIKELLAVGKSKKEVAEELSISVRTVQRVRANGEN